MTPERRAHIASVVTFLDQHRGRTVPPIREGGPHDGRARVEQDQDGFRTEHAQEERQ